MTALRCGYAWRDSGLWEQILAVFIMAIREAEGKCPEPTVTIVDSQSVKRKEAGGPSRYDAGKNVKGRKRRVAVDTLGLPIKCPLTTADVQDRDARAWAPKCNCRTWRIRRMESLSVGIRVPPIDCDGET